MVDDAVVSKPIIGARVLATAMRNIEPKSHAFMSEGIPTTACSIRWPYLRLRDGLRFLRVGFLLKPDVFGGVVVSIRLCVLSYTCEDCASFDIITEWIVREIILTMLKLQVT